MIPNRIKEKITSNARKGSSLYFGTVISADDPSRNGILLVHIPELTGTNKSTSALFDCIWTSPFAGATPQRGTGDKNAPDVAQTSYGMWMRPPDNGNQVVVGFYEYEGQLSGIILGCLFQTNRNFMVPGIPAGKSIGGVTPVNEANMSANIKDHNVEYSGTVKSVKVKADDRSMHELESVIFSQGLIDDFIRGQSTSGARREGASEVYGILTPGPKNPKDPGLRHAGHQFVMDDSNDNPFIRIRTGGGNQIVLNDAENLIYISNKSGTGHIEIDADGNIDIYGTGSYNVRTSGDMNLRADKDVNIEAGQNVNIKAANNYPHPNDPNETEKGVVDVEELAYLNPQYQDVLTNGSVNIEGVKDINMYSNAISIEARPRLFTVDGKTIPGSLQLFGDNKVHMAGTQVEIAAPVSVNNPPSEPTLHIKSMGDLDLFSTTHTHIMGLTKTYINAGDTVDIQTTVLPTIPPLPIVPNMSGIDTQKTTNTLLSFELAGILSGSYPKRAEQGKSPLTPLLLFDKKINTIITRWPGIEPSPSRTNK